MLKKNELIKTNGKIYRILDVKTDKVLLIDCIKKSMPKWENIGEISEYESCSEEDLIIETNAVIESMEELDTESQKFIHEHYSLIAGVLPFISDEKKRSNIISQIAEGRNISKQTIRNYLCLYLTYQNMTALAPKRKREEKPLSKDEKNMRWALNKFFYTKSKNSLNTAYSKMLKEKYCDSLGNLLPEYPTIHQFRYFYRKHKKLQTYYISRDGLKSYQRNNRPLLGDGVQEFAPNVGIGMLDSTICDIYLVDDARNLVGRPILTACIDAYSSLCCGYSLTWEGGIYSLRGLMLNIIADKKKYCEQFGIIIKDNDWNSSKLPGTFVTDMGSEYKSENFEQIAELGVTVINLPSYRPELKGSVEKFFDLVQDEYKKYLKGRGVIEPDFQERGAHDYRNDACLTMTDFEKIILKCIIYYNSQRIVENFPYTEEMIKAKVQPFANQIFEWGKLQDGANLLDIKNEKVILSLLPRTTGRFSRQGLKVNKMRYKHENYIEKYLSGGEAVVAYNPEDVSFVWLVENGAYIRFELIESRYKGKDLTDIMKIQEGKKELIKTATKTNTQAQINLARYIETIAASKEKNDKTNIKFIRKSRQREQSKRHIDYMKEGAINE